MSDAPATLLTPEATTDEVADSIMAKLEAANPETEPEIQIEPAAEAAAPEGEKPESEQETEPAAVEQPPVDQPKYKVKVRGEEREVPLDELLNGYSRTEDYKAKTAEVAEMRRAAEAEIAEQRGQQLAAIQQALALAQNFDPIIAEGQRTDWQALAQTDPTAYVQKRAAFEARLGEVQRLQAEQARLAQDRQNALIAEHSRALTEKLPEWGSEEGRARINKSVTTFLANSGFNDNEIKALVDHRVLIAMHKAARYDEMMAAQKSVAEKKTAPPAPKTQKPAASNDVKPKDARVVALKKQAIRSGRDDDIVNAVLASLGNS